MDLLTWRPRLRVLCIHGRCQTAATFKHKVERLVTKAESFAEFIFVDGPVELPTQHGDRENTRAWAPADDDGTLAILETLTRAWEQQGPFDGVLAFSEGARVAHLLACQAPPNGLDGVAASVASAEAVAAGLRFAVLAGGPTPSPTASGSPLPSLKSLHFVSAGDTVVPLADSQRLAEAFAFPEIVQHDGGHCFPQHADDIKRVVAFLEARREEIHPCRPKSEATLSCSLDDNEDERVVGDQRDELEALAAMLEESSELVRVSPAWPVRLVVRIPGLDGAMLRFTMSPGYPLTAPCICEFSADCFSLQVHRDDLMAAVEASREPVGLPSILAMVQGAQQWVEEHAADLAARASAYGTAAPSPISGDACNAGGETEDQEQTPADAWWLHEEAVVNEALLEQAERRSAEIIQETPAMPGQGGASASWGRECGAGGYGRTWEFIVGLVGKPSAGKSTFFNAATRPERSDREASMAPHPFTTIDPNVGAGWFAAPCPAMSLDLQSTARPEHGSLPNGQRRHPLLVKDVAGLVPGAYLGRGRGNAFLNDLVEADSLIHVVDASGRSDRDGVDQGAGASNASQAEKGGVASPSDPLDEVSWVRREIHLWIFCNIRAKWDTVRKRARIATSQVARDAVTDRLFALFTGYHASWQLVARVYESMGCSLQGIAETVLGWQEADLHLMVACFLRARFPIVVALNKADMPEAAARVEKARASLTAAGTCCVPVSARSEWWLWEQSRKGHLTYTEGGGAETVHLSQDAPAAVLHQWEQLRTRVLEPLGSTGVLEALTLAVMRRRPVFVAPVVDFISFKGLTRLCAGGGAPVAGSGSVGASASGAAEAKGGNSGGGSVGRGSRGGRGRGSGGGRDGNVSGGSGYDGSSSSVGGSKEAEASPLATLLMLRPASTVEEAYHALRHQHMLRGEFVRAELLVGGCGEGADSAAVRVLRKEDQLRAVPSGAVVPTGDEKDKAACSGLDAATLVLRVLTNKKAR
eukprot:TRINITY_DN27174_c0_g1_i1.p1 TRINITY_DN27174_c0_g1~~TRINITY_DN27174_c0_g1_i1.p1  ORF type:complete len:985 (-),score=186.35 TRINITY_DN27174_c0_g1_i1:68-3022(-)